MTSPGRADFQTGRARDDGQMTNRRADRALRLAHSKFIYNHSNFFSCRWRVRSIALARAIVFSPRRISPTRQDIVVRHRSVPYVLFSPGPLRTHLGPGGLGFLGKMRWHFQGTIFFPSTDPPFFRGDHIYRKILNTYSQDFRGLMAS